jgi:hypothetical protein
MLLVVVASAAAPKKQEPKNVLQKIQGKWIRRAHDISFEINSSTWNEFSEKNVAGKPTLTGSIETPPGKEYALVKASNGAVIWLFPNGSNALGVETFDRSGNIVGDGRVFYRPDFTP